MGAVDIRRDSIAWPAIEAWARARIEALRTDLEAAPPEESHKVAAIQGRIKELRYLLRQGEPEEPPQSGPVY